jgi:lipopolysaccharide/colanic/teichoic acid biosynthesis glycosyltransferase
MSPRFAKRALDLALLLPTMPFFAVVVGALIVVVLVFDGRPIFFTQERVGRGRKPFKIYKLRTMTTDPDITRRRPTALGARLRRHGVDELPQLFNILIGDMSLVGPRPLTPNDVVRLEPKHPNFGARFDAKPGLTGLAQVHRTDSVAESSALDAEYARRQNALLDIAILLRTTWINIVGKARGKLPYPA